MSVRCASAPPAPLTSTVQCPTAGCSNQGILIPVPTGGFDEESGQQLVIDDYACGVCGADVSSSLVETS